MSATTAHGTGRWSRKSHRRSKKPPASRSTSLCCPSIPGALGCAPNLGAGSAGIDIVQWSVGMAGWIAPHMEDHEPLLAQMKSRHADFDWNDYLTGTKKAATYDGKLVGIPYRITTGIFHYQKALLEQAGFSQPARHVGRIPEDRARREQAARALCASASSAVRAPACSSASMPWLYSNGGRPARLQDRRDLHQRRKGRRGADSSTPNWSPSTRSCRPRR